MAGAQKLFKAIRDSACKGAKRHIAHEISSTYGGLSAMANTLLSEALLLSESNVWEDRVCASRIVEEMVQICTVPDAFSAKEFTFQIDIESLLKKTKYLSSYYTTKGSPASVESSKEFIDLEDHNVVLSLSNIKIPGARKKEPAKKKKGRENSEQEKKEVESFSTFCAFVLKNLASYEWELRHGAAQMLLGMFRGMAARKKNMCVQESLNGEVFLCSLLSTLVRDQFNDYEMDVALSPVRETISKALQEMCAFLPESPREKMLSFLVSLGQSDEWQVRYSGLIGIKGVLGASNICLSTETAKSIANACVELLEDLDEDVRGLAASILSGVLQKKNEVLDIKKIADIPAVVELCWSVLAEEEDISASKSKIIALLETVHKIGHSLGKIDKEKYLSVLGLIRSPVDTVRCAVLSLLETLPIMSPADALSSVMYSIIMETEESVQKKSVCFLQKVASSVEKKEIETIVHAMLRIVCMSACAGDALKRLGHLIVIGETDICTTDDGCKAAGAERVFTGRVALFQALLGLPDALPFLISFFSQNTHSSLPLFYFFKSVMIARTNNTDLNLFNGKEGSEKMINRAAKALFSSHRDTCTCTKENAEALFHLFGEGTSTPLLKVLSCTLARDMEKYTPVYSMGVACIIQKEKEESDERIEKKEKKSVPGKRAKMEEFVEQDSASPLLVLIEEAGDCFLQTEAFAHIKKSPKECITFLKSTVHFFSCAEELLSLFSVAMEESSIEVTSHFIRHSKKHNEEYILSARESLMQMPLQKSADHGKALHFLECTSAASIPELLVVLIFPLISVMNTPFSVERVREAACKAFSSLVPFMHLRGEVHCNSQELLSLIQQERARIDELHKKENLSDLQINVTLRGYQEKGVEWLCFLGKSGLSGMLCDDMGLGKTVQVLAFIAHEKKKQNALLSSNEPVRTLVLCPSALTGHWKAEIASMFPTLKGASIQEYHREDVCIASYDKFRMSPDCFSRYTWQYLVLDEGHVIKNASTLLHARVKAVSAKQKILLSGTPIQNSVKELWALFDALMPGYLGTEKEFNSTYLKPILKGREGGTGLEIEVAQLKLEELHSKVLPFMLRRMKESVLSDLPPKVISDIRVPMEEEQRRLYEEIFAQGACSAAYGEVSTRSSSFAQLSKLIRVCSHPALVSPEEDLLNRSAAKKKRLLSGKMLALLDLLRSIIPQSKVLIFFQYKATIDLIAERVAEALPGTKWCRLDGGVKGDARASLAQKFNADPEISIMYLTTHAGGLGLNLTGADAVVFYEHDWNPMMDLQAMDRAHRLGQKKSVNVFRLITEETIEESIMSLQNFKKYVAKAVVNQQNVEIESMDTANALERFKKSSAPDKEVAKEEEYEDLI